MKKSIVKKSFFSLCIAAAMTVSGAYVPGVSLLSGTEIFAVSVSKEGKCGPDVNFSISDGGVLTISGKGPMYTDMSSSLWDRASVKSVVIEDGVTLIGDFAFAHHDNLVSVTIPETVKTINKGAFLDCASLQSVTIPDSVTSMGSQCFSLCRGLKKVTIGAGLETVPSIAFSYCSSLTEVDFGPNILYINNEAFSNCTSLQNVVLKNKVMTISDKAFFMCWSLKTITIPPSVTSIGKDAFLHCGTGEPGPDNNSLYGFTAYTVKGSYASEYVAALNDTKIEDTDPPEDISAFEYYDDVCVALGNDIYYKIVDSDDYTPFGMVTTYYIPGMSNKPGDIYGIKLENGNVQSFYSYAPQIKQNSLYKIDSLYTITEPVYADAEGLYIFGNVLAVYSDTCIEVDIDTDRIFVICDSTDGLSRGMNVCFTPYEIISGQNMMVYTTKNLQKTYYARGTCLGYNSELKGSLFLGTSGNYDKISQNDVGYFFVAGEESVTGQTAYSAHFALPEHFVNDIPVLSLYTQSITPGAEIITAVDDGTSEFQEGMLSVRYTDNGGLVYLDENTAVYLLNGIPKEAQPGDILKFRLLNTIEKGAYYAADVSITDKKSTPAVLGDIDGDGNVNITDLILLKSYIVSEVPEVDAVCDINQDTYFSVLDVVALVKLLMGM